jgi:hypothetical protein
VRGEGWIRENRLAGGHPAPPYSFGPIVPRYTLATTSLPPINGRLVTSFSLELLV